MQQANCLAGIKRIAKRKKKDKEPIDKDKPKKKPRTNTKKTEEGRVVKIIKTGLKSILTRHRPAKGQKGPAYYEEWFWHRAKQLSISQAKFCHRASILAKAFAIRRIDRGQNLPNFNKTFYIHCMMMASAEPAKCFARLREEEYDQDIADTWEELKEAFTGEPAPKFKTFMYEHLGHATKNMSTNLNVTISQNFESWLLRYCHFLIMTRKTLEQWKEATQSKCGLWRMQNQIFAWARRIRNMILFPKYYLESERRFKNPNKKNTAVWLPDELVDMGSVMSRWYDQYRNEKTGAVSSGKIKQFLPVFIKRGFYMLKLLEEHEGWINCKGELIKWKLWQVMPEHRSTRVNVRIDTTSLFVIVKNFRPELLKKFEVPIKKTTIEDKKKLWAMFNLPGNPRPAIKTSRKYRFDHSIVTDGLSCSVQFTIPKPTRDPESDKKQKDWKVPVAKVIEDLEQNDQKPYIFGMDPGRCNMLTVRGWIKDQNVFDPNTESIKVIFKAKHYHQLLKSKNKSNRMQNYLGTRDFQPRTNMSSSFEVLKERTTQLCQNRMQKSAHYETDLFCRQKWDTYIRRPKVLNRFVDGLVKKAREETDGQKPIFLLGNATFDHASHTTNRDPVGCNQALKKIFASRNDLTLLEVSEYMTTKLCARCDKESAKANKTVYYETEEGLKKSKMVMNRDMRHCQGCAHDKDHRILHRDYNAAINIRNKLYEAVGIRHH